MKIAVLRANALGDFIFALPALAALRQIFPSAQISYLGRPWHQKFLTNRPSPIDRTIVIPISFGVRDEPGSVEKKAELDSFFRKMKMEKFDIAIQIHGGGRYSNPFVTQLEAGKTIGLKASDAKSLDLWVPYIYYQNEYERYLEVISLISRNIFRLLPHIEVTKGDLIQLEKVLGSRRNYIVIHPGASDLRRRWSTKKFSQLAEYLLKKGETVVINGVESERGITSEVVKKLSGDVIDLTGRLTILALVGLLYRAKLVISNDTGPLHLAGALNTPTVGLFWCGNLINAGLSTRAFNRPLLSWVVNCPLCRRQCTKTSPFEPKFTDCNHEVSFMDDISLEEVEEAVDDLLYYLPFSKKIISKNR